MNEVSAPVNLERNETGYILHVTVPLSSRLMAELADSRETITDFRAIWKQDGGDINLLGQFPELKRVILIDYASTDLRPLDKLHGLEGLTVLRRHFDPDFANWPLLKRIEFHSDKNTFQNARQAERLRTIFVAEWKGKDLLPFSAFSALSDLTVALGSLRSLEGAARITHLSSLSLRQLRSLQSLDHLDGARHLVHLAIDHCPKVSRLDPISRLEHLADLSLDDGGKIESLAPLRSLKRLARLSLVGSTNIVDGNMAVICDMGIKNFRFMNRKHYNLRNDFLAPRGA